MSDREMVDVTGFFRAKSESGKAVKLDDGLRQEWVPISQIKYREAEFGAPGLVVVSMPFWLARDKRFI